MQPLTVAELATAAGTSAEIIERLVELGILHLERHEGARFAESDIARVRLVLALEASGLSLEALGQAIASQELSLDFIDQLIRDPCRLLPETHAQLLARLGVSRELSERVRRLLGTAGVDEGEPVREDDAEIFEILARASELGASDENGARIVRVMADHLRLIVDAERGFIDEVVIRPFMQTGAGEQEMLDATSESRREFRELGRRLLLLLHERLVEDAVFQNTVELSESVLERTGVRRPRDSSPPAIAFIDLTAYTRLTEESGDEAAAVQAGRFAELVGELSAANGGRLVKLLGDGAMTHFPDGDSAVRFALELLERAPTQELPPVRVGIDAGSVVRRDGDYFGSVVNAAARVADYARPRELLVTGRVAAAWTGGPDVRFNEIGPVALKNVAEPVELSQVFRL